MVGLAKRIAAIDFIGRLAERMMKKLRVLRYWRLPVADIIGKLASSAGERAVFIERIVGIAGNYQVEIIAIDAACQSSEEIVELEDIGDRSCLRTGL